MHSSPCHDEPLEINEEVTMPLPKFMYLSPKTKDELADALQEHGENAKILAGGTDIIPNMLAKLYTVDTLVDVKDVKEMNSISYDEAKGLVIGAATKMKAVAGSPIIKEKYGALHRAASEVGSPQIRAMATIGGNSCNASPAADTPPALVALGASVALTSKQGTRKMLLEDFIKGNRITDLKPGEFLESFTVPDVAPNSASRFGLCTLRAAVEIDVASLAVSLALNDSKKVKVIRIAMGSVAPIPLRAKETEQMLLGRILDDEQIDKASEKCATESNPIGDIRASADYRRHLIKVLTKRTIIETMAAIG